MDGVARRSAGGTPDAIVQMPGRDAERIRVVAHARRGQEPLVDHPQEGAHVRRLGVNHPGRRPEQTLHGDEHPVEQRAQRVGGVGPQRLQLVAHRVGEPHQAPELRPLDVHRAPSGAAGEERERRGRSRRDAIHPRRLEEHQSAREALAGQRPAAALAGRRHDPTIRAHVDGLAVEMDVTARGADQRDLGEGQDMGRGRRDEARQRTGIRRIHEQQRTILARVERDRTRRLRTGGPGPWPRDRRRHVAKHAMRATHSSPGPSSIMRSSATAPSGRHRRMRAGGAPDRHPPRQAAGNYRVRDPRIHHAKACARVGASRDRMS